MILQDFVGKKVSINIRDDEIIEGVLKSIDSGGYLIEVEDPDDNQVTTRFIPEHGNVIYVEVNGRFY